MAGTVCSSHAELASVMMTVGTGDGAVKAWRPGEEQAHDRAERCALEGPLTAIHGLAVLAYSELDPPIALSVDWLLILSGVSVLSSVRPDLWRT